MAEQQFVMPESFLGYWDDYVNPDTQAPVDSNDLEHESTGNADRKIWMGVRGGKMRRRHRSQCEREQ